MSKITRKITNKMLIRLVKIGLLGKNGFPSSGGGVPSAAFNFNPMTAKLIYSGDSINTLDDDTGPMYHASGLTGGPLPISNFARQSVSGSEINEGDINTNTHDLLYPSRLALLVSALRSGDVFSDGGIGTNTVNAGAESLMIAGFIALYGPLLEKGVFIEAMTMRPSQTILSTGAITASAQAVNNWKRALPTTGLTYNGVFYPGSNFICVDIWAAWGGTHIGRVDALGLHNNWYGSYLEGCARRDAYKAIGRAYHPLIYGLSNLSGNVLTNWNLAAGTTGTLTGSGTLINNGVPTGIAVANGIAGLTVQTDIITSYSPIDSIYSDVAAFPVLRVRVTGTSAEATDKDITITMSQSITSEPAGSSFEASCYNRVKGTATDNPTGAFADGFGYGSVAKYGSHNSAKAAGFSKIIAGHEKVMRTRSTPPPSVFGSASIVYTMRVLAGDTADFDIFFGQPYAGRTERVAYAIPKSLNTDQASIGGVLTGPQVGTNNTSFSISNGVALTGRVGVAWFGGGLTFKIKWIKIAVDGVTETLLSGPTTITTTASTLQFTPSGFVTGEKLVMEVEATNTFGTGISRSVVSNAHA